MFQTNTHSCPTCTLSCSVLNDPSLRVKEQVCRDCNVARTCRLSPSIWHASVSAIIVVTARCKHLYPQVEYWRTQAACTCTRLYTWCKCGLTSQSIQDHVGDVSWQAIDCIGADNKHISTLNSWIHWTKITMRVLQRWHSVFLFFHEWLI